MVEQISKEQEVPQEIKEQTPAQAEPVQAAVTEDDIIKRASQVKLEQKPKETNPFGLTNDDWQKVQSDPVLQKYYRSMASDYERKTQQIAEIRRDYEKKLSQTDDKWTPEKVQSLLQRQDFVQAAQAVAGNQQETGSMLSESERMKIQQAEQSAKAAQAQLYQLQQQQIHSTLRNKYSNYDPEIVNNDLNQVMSGKVSNDTFIESIWRARDYESAVKRAYQLGLQDKNEQNKERAAGMTFATGNNMAQPTGVERQKGEPIAQFLARSYSEHAKKK
jgi:hypothetical protein